MNSPARTTARPAPAASATHRPQTAPSFGQGQPPLTVRVSTTTRLTTRPIVCRPFATSRLGYDHSWIGLLVCVATLFVAG